LAKIALLLARTDLGSPVSLDYFDRRPFQFDGAG
jgi:hypothetical protein